MRWIFTLSLIFACAACTKPSVPGSVGDALRDNQGSTEPGKGESMSTPAPPKEL